MEWSGRRRSTSGGSGRTELAAEVKKDLTFSNLLMRLIGASTVGLVIAAAPLDLTVFERLVISITFIVVFPVISLMLGRLGPAGWSGMFQNMSDSMLANLVTWFVPALWPANLAYQGAMLSLNLPLQRRRPLFALAAVSIGGWSYVGWWTGAALWYVPGLVVAAVMLPYDMYARQRSQRRRETTDRMNRLISASDVVYWEFDLVEHRFVTVVGNSLMITGYEPSELVGMHWRQMVDPEEFERVKGLRPEGAGSSDYDVMVKLLHRDGRVLTCRHLLQLETSQLVKGLTSDVTALASAAETIRYQAQHDVLTGLANRDVLNDRLETVLRQASIEEPAALLMLDLDRFKEVNDTLGHHVGDKILQVLASRFSEEIDEAMCVARLGGDEFALLLGRADRRAAIQVAAKIAQATERQIDVSHVKLAVAASIGVVMIPEQADSSEEVMRCADIAMYDAKRSGDIVRIYHTTPAELTLDRLTLSAGVCGALESGQFELWFQPKVDLDTKAIVGAEGLARWRHPERGVLLPDQFIDLVVLSGEYHLFARKMLSAGLDLLGDCDRQNLPLGVAVNLSSMSFFDRELPDWLAREIVRRDVDPRRFTLEITESEFFETSTHGNVFEAIHGLGVGLSIDDFGTGYSSLARLRDLPATELKLDRSFVSSMVSDNESRLIVRTVIELANILNQSVVAEGVEDTATAELLLAMGCPVAQGFLYARPAPTHEFMDFVHNWPQGTASFGGYLSSSQASGEFGRRSSVLEA